MLKYTTIERLATILKGRIPFGTSTHIGGQSIDMDFVALRGEQVEGVLDLMLAQIYEMPLRNNAHPILSLIIEKWLESEFLKTIPKQSADPVMQGQMFVPNEALYYIQLLTAGHNIPIPGLPPVQSIPGVATAQPVFLPGEIARLSPPDTITQSVTMLARRSFPNQDGLDWRQEFWVEPSRWTERSSIPNDRRWR